jgi:hypothetical protein
MRGKCLGETGIGYCVPGSQFVKREVFVSETSRLFFGPFIGRLIDSGMFCVL